MQRTKQNARRAKNLSSLEGLGFGPESILMSDPKLFLDSSFLAIVTAEFDHELGKDCSGQALQEIGRHHGLADAARTLATDTAEDYVRGLPPAQYGPHLAMQFESSPQNKGEFSLRGSWPECHEARARLSRLGSSDAPSCFLSAGYCAGWLAEIYDANVEVVETACQARGDARCEFEAHLSGVEVPAPAPDSREPESNAALQDLPTTFGPEISDSAAANSPYPSIDPQDDAVHVWGPVMVLPFVDPEVSERTLMELADDPFTRDIKAVVIDLRGEPIDGRRGLVSIERIMKVIDRWGAQAIFAWVSPANEELLQLFDSACHLGQKKLAEAIAMGFQVAEAQRHAV